MKISFCGASSTGEGWPDCGKNFRFFFNRFKTLEEIGPAYKVELRKDKITIDRPFQVGIVVYQLAKLRMLQFYYEFLDFYLDRRDFELIQMDTDSMYFALSREKLEDAVRPGYAALFEEKKKRWLAWDKWSNREPGLFKLEKEATSGIALCSKCYHMKDRVGYIQAKLRRLEHYN